MTKRFECDDPSEYRSYAIADVSKSDKTKEDFLDENEEIYDIIAFDDYLWEKGCYMTGEEVENQLNKLYEENQTLKQALLFYLDVAILETSSCITEDMELACQDLFGMSYGETKEKYDGFEEEWRDD